MSTQAPTQTALAWRRVQAGATLAVSLSLYLVIIVAAEMIPPVLVFGTLYLLVAAAVWRLPASRPVSIGGAVLVLLGMLGNIQFFVADLSHPETAGTFAPAAITLVSAIAAIGASVMSVRGGSAEATRSYSLGTVAAAAVLVLVSLAFTFTASSDEAQAGDITVVVEGAEYPAMVQAAPGATLFIDNRDRIRHTFVVEGADVKVELPGAKSRRVQIDLPAGEYTFICDVPGHDSMTGTLTVQ